MLGFVVVFSFLWVVWATSPLSEPLLGEVGNPIPDMLVVLIIAAMAIVMAARIQRSQLFTKRFGSRFGALIAIMLFALSVYPPFYFSANAVVSERMSSPDWYIITPGLIEHLLDAYSLQGVILAAVSTAWITAMLLRYPKDRSAE